MNQAQIYERCYTHERVRRLDPLGRYHRFPWQEGPQQGELEYLRYVRVSVYEVRPAQPWDGYGALHNLQLTKSPVV